MKDSLKITQNKDGSFTFDWDPQDQLWNWLNGKTSDEIRAILMDEMQTHHKGRNYDS